MERRSAAHTRRSLISARTNVVAALRNTSADASQIRAKRVRSTVTPRASCRSPVPKPKRRQDSDRGLKRSGPDPGLRPPARKRLATAPRKPTAMTARCRRFAGCSPDPMSHTAALIQSSSAVVRSARPAPMPYVQSPDVLTPPFCDGALASQDDAVEEKPERSTGLGQSPHGVGSPSAGGRRRSGPQLWEGEREQSGLGLDRSPLTSEVISAGRPNAAPSL